MSNMGRSSHPEVFLGKCVLKTFSKFAGEHPCRSAISHFGMGALLWICCMSSEHLFLRTPLGGCFCMEFFLLCISQYLDWIREVKIAAWTLQWFILLKMSINLTYYWNIYHGSRRRGGQGGLGLPTFLLSKYFF